MVVHAIVLTGAALEANGQVRGSTHSLLPFRRIRPSVPRGVGPRHSLPASHATSGANPPDPQTARARNLPHAQASRTSDPLLPVLFTTTPHPLCPRTSLVAVLCPPLFRAYCSTDASVVYHQVMQPQRGLRKDHRKRLCRPTSHIFEHLQHRHSQGHVETHCRVVRRVRTCSTPTTTLRPVKHDQSTFAVALSLNLLRGRRQHLLKSIVLTLVSWPKPVIYIHIYS